MEKTPPDFPHHGKPLTREHIRSWLDLTGAPLRNLYHRADSLRRHIHGDSVPIRAIIEFSNICSNDCLYCGIRASNPNPVRYKMPPAEILQAVREIAADGIAGTIVLQGGETPGPSDSDLTALIRRIKTDFPHLAVTLSVGDRPRDTYARWRDAGMDRFLLRFETSVPALFQTLHPHSTLQHRLDCLQTLHNLGVQTGGGFMIGIPGETPDTLAGNIWLCHQHAFHMIGIGPFIPHPGTPLGNQPNAYASDPDMFFRAIAALRLANPNAHIPATTALDAQFPNGRDLALQRGANVFMPNATPKKYRANYQLYPGKPHIDHDSTTSLQQVKSRLRHLNRPIAP